MTFVIIGGGIDLSVGAVDGAGLGLGDDDGDPGRTAPAAWSSCALAVGVGCRPGQRPADRVRPDGAVHRHARDAGRRPRPGDQRISDGSTQTADADNQTRSNLGYQDPAARRSRCWSSSSRRGRVVGWIVLNRTTFGRRTFAIGGNPEAARLAGINVRLHTCCCTRCPACAAASPAIMLIILTTSGTSRQRQPLRARRHRRGDHRRNAAHRRTRHARRLGPRCVWSSR